MKHLHWKSILLTAIICLLLFVALIFYCYHSFTAMGEEQISQKTANYNALAQTAPQHGIVFFGDSITELCPVEELYVDYAREIGQPIINRGISSEKTQEMLARLETSVLDIKPSKLILLMGINDFFAGVDNDRIYSNIKEIIQITKRKSPDTDIILSSIYPINPSQRNSLLEKLQMMGKDITDIDALNVKLKKLAQQEHIVFVDMDEVLKDAQGMLKKEYSYDGLHPNTEGYLAIRPKIMEALKNTQ